MNPHVISVEVKQEYVLKLAFANKEVRLFDASPFLDKGIFNELKDISYFKQVKVYLVQLNGLTNKILAKTLFIC